VDGRRWLLLSHQLPQGRSNARVKIWRRLQQIGAVPTRNAVYVLPNLEQCREDFEWLRTEIAALGGEATVFTADAISAGGADAIEAAFRATRDEEYRELAERIEALLPRFQRKSRRKERATGREMRALRDRFQAIGRTDFFGASGRTRAAAALAKLEELVIAPGSKLAGPAPTLSPKDFRGRRWVTRPRPGVDRMASAWLIRRYIDPRATFRFSSQPAVGDVPFDMFAGEFSHQGEACTFEVLAERFGIAHPQVARIGQVVHDLDMKDAKYGAPDATTVGRLVEGLRESHLDDASLIEQGIALFEALGKAFEADRSVGEGSGRSKRRTKRQ
jgi:hypothetical protein